MHVLVRSVLCCVGRVCVVQVPHDTRSFPAALVELARAATRQCSDLPRLLDASCLLCHLLAYPNPCRTSAYQGILVLLANKYPKVIKTIGVLTIVCGICVFPWPAGLPLPLPHVCVPRHASAAGEQMPQGEGVQ